MLEPGPSPSYLMADVFSPEKRSQVMAAVRSRGNRATEGRLAEIFRARGIRGWRRHLPLPGRPDFAFRAGRVAVFIDGCFWHGCPRHLRMPASNRAYWRAKIASNQRRDRAVTLELRRRGWKVLRFWAHDLAREAALARRVLAALGQR